MIRRTSAASVWELGIKQAMGKLALRDLIRLLVLRAGFAELPMTMRHGETAAALPMLHRDPLDRMLVAQATWKR